MWSLGVVMTLLVSSKSMSLVEQKRLQWAREREEMAGLCAPWGPSTNRDAYRPSIRTHFLSSTELNQSNDSLYTQGLSEAVAKMRRRSPSLPPISTRTMQQVKQLQQEEDVVGRGEDEREEETSGYASESGFNERNHSEYWLKQREATWAAQHQEQQHQQLVQLPGRQHNRGYTTPDSVVSTPPHRWSCISSDESNRPRWGDRGVGVGHLWEPAFHEPDCRLPQVQGNERGTPSWLERGLSKLDDTQVLVINHGPESRLDRELAGSCDTLNTQSQMDYGRTFLRGQNVPVEPEVLMERERKRQRALEHQNAIRQQLEERDRKRKEERERRIKEEREEEERIKREQERERQRLEEEQRKQKEREDKEARKAKAMREALENAEKLARQEKIRASRKHISQLGSESERRTCVSVSSEQELSKIRYSSRTTEAGDSPRVLESPRSTTESQSNGMVVATVKQPMSDQRVLSEMQGKGPQGMLIATDGLAVPADGLAVVLGSPGVDGAGGQLALLMSPSTLQHQQSLVLENRLLTPSKYRSHARERATQTDSEGLTSTRTSRSKIKKDSRKDRKKSASLEGPHRGCKLPLRCRSQSQPGQARVNLEDRPKWGVNRPGTQYMKQSEKDPYYQRRLRQRLLRAAMLAEGVGGGDTGTESDTGSRRRQRHRRGSSEENSRSPSPPGMNNRNLYQQHSQRLSDRIEEKHDISIISLDLSTLDSLDNEQINNSKKSLSYHNDTNKRVQVVIPSQNISYRPIENVSQKKGCNRNNMAKHLCLKGGGSQRLLNRKAQAPATLNTKGSQCLKQWSSHDILSQLSSLREGLLIKQQEWESQRSQTPQSESSWKS